jgi:hypothetical protein
MDYGQSAHFFFKVFEILVERNFFMSKFEFEVALGAFIEKRELLRILAIEISENNILFSSFV